MPIKHYSLIWWVIWYNYITVLDFLCIFRVKSTPNSPRKSVQIVEGKRDGTTGKVKQKIILLQGIQCYAGNVQHIASYNERKHASLSALKKAAAVKQQFLDNGLCCDIMTGSGTGTYEMDMTLAAVTENKLISFYMVAT